MSERDAMADIQTVPALESGRPETGVMQFGDDWPGVFLRGDDALAFALDLYAVLNDNDSDIFRRAGAENLLRILTGADVTGMAGELFGPSTTRQSHE